jgi:hypothetical protein
LPPSLDAANGKKTKEQKNYKQSVHQADSKGKAINNLQALSQPLAATAVEEKQESLLRSPPR